MFDWQSLLKYLLEGLAVGLATFLIPSKKVSYNDIIIVALIAAAVFAILDQFSPGVAIGARQGTGFSIGYQQIGLGPGEDTNASTSKVCQMSGDICSYHPEITSDQRDKFVCKKQDNQCVPMMACKHTQGCDWENGAENLPDSSGRVCSLVDNKCRLTNPPTVEGFDGFSKLS